MRPPSYAVAVVVIIIDGFVIDGGARVGDEIVDVAAAQQAVLPDEVLGDGRHRVARGADGNHILLGEAYLAGRAVRAAVELEEGLHVGVVEVGRGDVESGDHLAAGGAGDDGIHGLAGHGEGVLRHDTLEEAVAGDELVEELAVDVEGVDVLACGLEHGEDADADVAVEEDEVVVFIHHGLHLADGHVAHGEDVCVGFEGLEGLGALDARTVGHGESGDAVGGDMGSHGASGGGVVGAEVGTRGQRAGVADGRVEDNHRDAALGGQGSHRGLGTLAVGTEAGNEDDALQLLTALPEFLHGGHLLLIGILGRSGVIVGLEALLRAGAAESGLNLTPIVDLPVLDNHGDALAGGVFLVFLARGEKACAADNGGGEHHEDSFHIVCVLLGY